MDTRALLKELSEASGVSGYEHQVGERIRGALGPLADELRTDALGNVIAVKRGRQTCEPRRALMLAAHSDEIGLMVTAIEQGFLRFTTVGGFDLRTLVGQEVVVHGRRDLPGMVATRPPHVLTAEERKKAIPLQELFVDVGLAADQLQGLVRVGDLITLRRTMIELAGGYVAGKAFDDRVAVASLAICLDALRSLQHDWDVYTVATSQEEVGLRGAIVSAYGLAPDVAIAIDVTFGVQSDVNDTEGLKLDGGPGLAVGPNVHPAMLDLLKKVAQRYELKYQLEPIPGASGTDAWALQVARQGIPTALVGIPLRYMHTSVETVAISDIERTGRLLAWFASALDDAFVSNLYAAGGATL
jgi:endoglucanase